MEIVIIGGIAAGMSTAAKARREDPNAKITVIEKEDYISFGACGLPYYLGGQFDDSQKMFARSPEQMIEAGVNVLTRHEAIEVNYSKKTVQVKNLSDQSVVELNYDRLMIATGARPITLGLNGENVYNFTRLNEVDAIKEKLNDWDHISIVGAGFIGLEVADQLLDLGKSVTIFERNDRAMKNTFDHEFSEQLAEALTKAGCTLHFNESVQSLKKENGVVTAVETDQGVYETDAVILALGFKPATEIFIDPELEMLDNGAIVIDRYGRTSIKDVYAAGDCATVYNIHKGNVYMPLATSANKLGRLIGENITKDEADQREFIGSLASACIYVAGYELGRTGLSESDAQELGINYKAKLIKGSNHTGYWPGRTPVQIKLIYEADTKVILGAQVMGEKDAVTRMTALTTAIYSGLTTQELGYMDYSYAPPFATTWDVLNVAGNASK